jgi:DNA-binding PadR family transcriptional regulator
MIPRELIKGTLKYMVLNLLQTQPKFYGYEITQVRAETENVNNRTRKYYSLTPKGGKETDSRMSDFREYIDLIKNLFY